MGLAASLRRNASDLVVIIAIALVAIALVIATVSLLARM